jgi:16S rRNA (uracil1498-N3)-methyltransferase
MSEHRVFTTIPLNADAPVVLNGPQAHYLGHVLRVRINDTITLFDGSGSEFAATVMSVERKRVELKLGDSITPSTESNLQVTLVQSVIRGERMDFCVQKATELGVSRIVPVFTDRTVVKIPKDRTQKRVDHWHKTAISACEQSGRVRIPAIDHPRVLSEAVAELLTADMQVLMLDPWADAQPLHSLPAPSSNRVAVCIGPEGGFSDDELDFLRGSGALSVTCGPRVLRSETAGIIAVAACQMAWGDWQFGRLPQA